jgi:opacity protein-like surface antigen
MSPHRVTGRPGRAAGLALVALVAGGAVAVPAGAQPTGGRGFLFDAPTATVIVRGGYAHSSAGGDLFSFTREQLTLDRGDFASPTYGLDLAVHVTPRLDVVVGALRARTVVGSEYRRWVDQDDRPIKQTTDFQRIPVTASVRAYLVPRGRALGQFAWVPARLAPYVGAGAGAVWHRFKQQGAFVDVATRDVSDDRVETSGWGPTAHAMAGVDVSLSNHFGVTTEARYAYARGRVGGGYEGFDRIDLSGATATVGMFVRF